MQTDGQTLLDFTTLVSAVHGSAVAPADTDFCFTSVAIDSRKCVASSLFVPLIGTQQDGHAYIPQAIENGATVIFVAQSEYETKPDFYRTLSDEKCVAFIIVKNTMTALQDAAACYVAQFPDLIKIGITGSSGKTTTKEIMANVLSQKFNVVMNEGNLNSETGLPLSVFAIRAEHEVGIFEMGMNRRGEIAEIARVLLPSIAVITNIGTAHIGILGSRAAIAEEKKNIFAHFTKNSVGFVSETDSFARFLADVPCGTVNTFGLHSNKRVSDVASSTLDGTVFAYDNSFVCFPIPGKHNFYNALAAINVAEYLRLSPAEIKKGLETVKTIFGRSQVYRGEKTLVHDCYNANPDSMESAITFCDDLDWKGKRIYVLGDMLELGEMSQTEHEKIGARVASSAVDYALFFGEQMKYAYEACKGKKQSFWSADITDIINELKVNACTGDLVMLKASKGMALWRAAEALEITIGGNA